MVKNKSRSKQLSLWNFISKEKRERREELGSDDSKLVLDELISDLVGKKANRNVHGLGREQVELPPKSVKNKESNTDSVASHTNVYGNDYADSSVLVRIDKRIASEHVKDDESVKIIKYSGMQLVKEPLEAVEGVTGYLLSTYYDGLKGVVAIKLYDDKSETMYVYYDKTGYKPYFLTDIPPDKVQEIKSVVTHSGFERVEIVRKYDLLRGKERTLTKIVTKTPDVVRVLREKVPKAWEANIKFHHNYIYDYGLVPGMRYRIVGKSMEIVMPNLDDKDVEKIREVFHGEDESTIRMAVEWLPLFEEAPPRVRRIAIDIEVYTPFKGRVPDANEASYPVISVAFASNDGFKAVFLLGIHGKSFGDADLPNDALIEIFDNERALIIETLRIIAQYPLVLSFNGDNFDFPYIFNRAIKLNIPRDHIPFRHTREYVSLKYGLHIDLYKFFSIKAIQSYAFGNAYKEFTLDAISAALLGERKLEIETSISELPFSELVKYNLRDAELTLKLTLFNDELVWKLIVLLMRISRLPLEDVTRSQVSAWIKSLLYWEHRRRNYLIPLPKEIRQLKGEVKSEAIVKGKKYMGALVLDPPSGVFFNVVVLDFASLYPSIIKKWNLSYETVNPVECPGDKIVVIPDVSHKVCMSKPGLTAQIVGLLRDYRVRVYKKKAKSKDLPPEVRAWYDTVQAAMKVYINASYGVFGASNFPFYAPPVAESVTAIGRHTIKATVQKAGELGLRVLYGDTDSLFIWHPSEEALKRLRDYVDREFGLELEIDKSYKLLTFTGLKKNYLGVFNEGGVDVKGLVAKKRNTPEFLKKEFKEILDMIGKIDTPFDVIRFREHMRKKLREIYVKLKGYEYNLDELAIKMGLSKHVSSYDKNTPPHVKAARQLVSIGIEVLPGDVISFVKVKGKDGVKPIQLARLTEIDLDKYIEQVKSTFEQVLRAFDVSWDEIIGASRLDMFIKVK